MNGLNGQDGEDGKDGADGVGITDNKYVANFFKEKGCEVEEL